MKRCEWCGDDELYMKYHDEEWGIPCHNDHILFEFLVLESMQAGLNWLTILRKRENFRKAFDNFDIVKVASYDEAKIQELLQNAGIIRNKLKVRAAVNNAQRYIEIQKEFGSFDNYVWGFVNHKTIINTFNNMNEVPSSTELSDKISKEMKKRGFKFIGTTIIYAYMQATGILNDHVVGCYRYKELTEN